MEQSAAKYVAPGFLESAGIYRQLKVVPSHKLVWSVTLKENCSRTRKLYVY